LRNTSSSEVKIIFETLSLFDARKTRFTFPVISDVEIFGEKISTAMSNKLLECDEDDDYETDDELLFHGIERA